MHVWAGVAKLALLNEVLRYAHGVLRARALYARSTSCAQRNTADICGEPNAEEPCTQALQWFYHPLH